MSVRLIEGDCLEVIPRLVAEGVVIDAVVTDPPYGLEFMGVAWDTMRENGKSRVVNEWGDFGSREHARGQHDIARVMAKKNRSFQDFSEAWARTMFQILRPGGYLVSLGGTRTFHRLTCAIEDTGLVIQDCLMWLYGSGFPKGKHMLKPAWEPIIMAFKPAGKRSLQVDESRIETNGEDMGDPSRFIGIETHRSNGWDRPHKHDADDMLQRKIAASERAKSLGRWPANVIHDGSDEVMEAFAAYGPKSSGVLKAGTQRNSRSVCYGKMPDTAALKDFGGDSGSAARFFYSAKADKQDRWGSKHPTVKPVELIRYLVKLVTPSGGLFLDPFAGSGTAAVAAMAEGRDAILIEREPNYCADIRERIAYYEGDGRHSLVARNRHAADKAGELI